MALFVIASAKGSPGVTTTAVALAGVWPVTPTVADLDPAGGDIALRYRDRSGAPLDPDRGLLSLGAAARRGAAEVDVAAHLQELSGGLRVLVGVSAPSQVHGLGPAWQSVARMLRADPERDVLADCGRVLPGSATMPLLQHADALLLIARPTVEGLSHLRERIHALGEALRSAGPEPVPIAVGLIASYRDSAVTGRVQRLLTESGSTARVLGILADDAKAAQALRSGDGPRARRSLLMRSAVPIAEGLAALGSGPAALDASSVVAADRN